MQKGQMVKCVSTKNDYLTAGKVYPVEAGEGDANMSEHIASVQPNHNRYSFNIIDDSGDVIYAIMDGAHGRFELVNDGDHDA